MNDFITSQMLIRMTSFQFCFIDEKLIQTENLEMGKIDFSTKGWQGRQPKLQTRFSLRACLVLHFPVTLLQLNFSHSLEWSHFNLPAIH